MQSRPDACRGEVHPGASRPPGSRPTSPPLPPQSGDPNLSHRNTRFLDRPHSVDSAPRVLRTVDSAPRVLRTVDSAPRVLRTVALRPRTPYGGLCAPRTPYLAYRGTPPATSALPCQALDAPITASPHIPRRVYPRPDLPQHRLRCAASAHSVDFALRRTRLPAHPRLMYRRTSPLDKSAYLPTRTSPSRYLGPDTPRIPAACARTSTYSAHGLLAYSVPMRSTHRRPAPGDTPWAVRTFPVTHPGGARVPAYLRTCAPAYLGPGARCSGRTGGSSGAGSPAA